LSWLATNQSINQEFRVTWTTFQARGFGCEFSNILELPAFAGPLQKSIKPFSNLSFENAVTVKCNVQH
jgi:hypothetical protein